MQHALDVIEINSIAPVLVTQKLLNKMSDDSTIVMMSSLMGSISDCMSGRSYAYRASKTALNMFSIAMKNELESQGISILIMHPGWVETDIGGPHAPLSVEESVQGIIQRIEDQTLEMTGRYVQFDGTPIEWCSKRFNDHCNALTTANTCGCNSILSATSLKFVR